MACCPHGLKEPAMLQGRHACLRRGSSLRCRVLRVLSNIKGLKFGDSTERFLGAQESEKEEPLLAQRENSFQSANSADSFTSARSKAASNAGAVLFYTKSLLFTPMHWWTQGVLQALQSDRVRGDASQCLCPQLHACMRSHGPQAPILGSAISCRSCVRSALSLLAAAGKLTVLCCGAGSFTSAAAAPGSSRPSDKSEAFVDAPARGDDSFTSAASYGQASAVSARQLRVRKVRRPGARIPSLRLSRQSPLHPPLKNVLSCSDT